MRAIAADRSEPATFFCGGSRNVARFIDVFDAVFVLEVDLDTLLRRLSERGDDEWGAKPSERDLVVRLHATREDVSAEGVAIDATQPLAAVVDEIVRRARVPARQDDPHE